MKNRQHRTETQLISWFRILISTGEVDNQLEEFLLIILQWFPLDSSKQMKLGIINFQFPVTMEWWSQLEIDWLQTNGKLCFFLNKINKIILFIFHYSPWLNLSQSRVLLEILNQMNSIWMITLSHPSKLNIEKLQGEVKLDWDWKRAQILLTPFLSPILWIMLLKFLVKMDV